MTIDNKIYEENKINKNISYSPSVNNIIELFASSEK